MFDLFNAYMSDAEKLVKGAVMVVAIFGVAATYVRTKALVPTVGAVLLGAIAWFGVTNFRELGEEIDRDADREQRDIDPTLDASTADSGN